MSTLHSVVMAAEFKDMGDHLLGLGSGWAEKTLKLSLIGIVVTKVIQKFSLKAGIGGLLGLVICLGIYSARGDLADYFKNELLNNGAPTPVEAPLDPGPGSHKATTTVHGAGGERA
ncbi:hypothetical protein ABZT43_50825 [Streptomyces sp. NPDC005349]|uniref:hypothetical protein n=1 Tax=Streptomyces sp. NPDC005349 TaxID=3157037 RepID=UPI0033ACB9B3